MADPKHPRHYDEAFKRQIVQSCEDGKPSREIRAEYDIAREQGMRARTRASGSNRARRGPTKPGSRTCWTRGSDGYAPHTHLASDLTYVRVGGGWAYVCLLVDLANRGIADHSAGRTRDASLVLANGTLADACSTLKDGEKPIIHSNRSYHYRWPEWIRICMERDLTRSMRAKGCSPDNAAAEGFLGRPRQEFLHKRSFAGISMAGVINMLDDHRA